MNINTQLEQLTTADKIRTMEYLWDELCRQADEIRSPAWHGDVLSQREKTISENNSAFCDWEIEKARIRNVLK